MARNEPEIDPRYAAQFQRGFDPEHHVAQPVETPREQQPRVEPPLISAPRPAAALRVDDRPVVTHAPLPAPVDVDALVSADVDVDEEDLGDESHPRVSWRDWLLPAVGAALVLVALWLWWGLGTDTTGYYGGVDQSDEWAIFLVQLRYVLPGPLFIGGVLAITAGLVLQALRGRR